jgi:hypothetical protein
MLEPRLFAAVEDACAVEKKTFIDMVMKKCRDSVLKDRERWVQVVAKKHSSKLVQK